MTVGFKSWWSGAPVIDESTVVPLRRVTLTVRSWVSASDSQRSLSRWVVPAIEFVPVTPEGEGATRRLSARIVLSALLFAGDDECDSVRIDTWRDLKTRASSVAFTSSRAFSLIDDEALTAPE